MPGKVRLIGAGAAASVALFVAVGAAFADNGSQTIPFKATYDDNFSGERFVCSGVRIVKTAPNAFVKDSEDCTIDNTNNSYPPGTYTQDNVPWVLAGVPGGWLSDYDGQETSAFTLVVTDNGDGTEHMKVVAYY
jgi:hypothetical protein